MSKALKTFISAVAFLAIPFFLTASGPEGPWGEGACKTQIVHRTGNGQILIWVDDDAVEGHREHGDPIKAKVCKDIIKK